MGSAKQEVAAYNVMSLLREWDHGTKEKRRLILLDFIHQHQNRSGPEIELELAQMASLLLARISVWLKLTYMSGNCLTEILQSVHIFLSGSSCHTFLSEFLEHGGVLTLLEILGLLTSKEIDKEWALKNLHCIASAGTKYKEVLCESYGIRAVAECLAKSKSERTQESSRYLLQLLADGNPRYAEQVYKGLIGVLPCTSPTAQKMAASTLRFVQPIVGRANGTIVERLLNLLSTLHLEVQSAALELIRDLMAYEVRNDLLVGLVQLLRPVREAKTGLITDEFDSNEESTAPLPIYVKQAAAGKTLGVLAKDSDDLAKEIVVAGAVPNLMFAMGNLDYADSQRQASMTLEYICQLVPVVNEVVREAMGESLYDQFMQNSEALYVSMNPVQADVLISNKVNMRQTNVEPED